MRAKIIVFINSAISIIAVYLVMLYAKMDWWFRDAIWKCRDASSGGLNSRDLGLRFVSIADQLAIIAIVLAALATFTNVALWKSQLIGHRSGLVLLCFSVLCLGICIISRF
jgi:hypothetical protein